NRILQHFTCPISHEVMNDPLMAADGHTYEAKFIRDWFRRGHNTSPITNVELEHKKLVPNRALRSAIEECRK
ncbi:U-box domain-containing protein, partial [Vibrio parahaemolyticus]|nr:U-box domain-containing protein [Vibrio parahaemolyticus]